MKWKKKYTQIFEVEICGKVSRIIYNCLHYTSSNTNDTVLKLYTYIQCKKNALFFCAILIWNNKYCN